MAIGKLETSKIGWLELEYMRSKRVPWEFYSFLS